ncbi:M56 family metallopeptidase [Mucilaginibacter boryungensis]|uniref:M56 family metallopeptidase n=1 Tax=Mucilaginibacter boryungensis TaxID=768480 RepID=A0ABR9XNN6_9SPHI|nr:M56 family metallopeptidase [Mucilaginibacter boryungensis]MBE9668754.1 M56 family metallopeptidase [Mucilaginibacter boryungensis]
MTWWHYLLLANVYLTLFFTFYALFLRKETFFNLNRVYLVSSALLSFMIPVIQSDWIKTLFITQKVQETIYHVGPAVMYSFNVTAKAEHALTLGQIAGGIYALGILVLTVKFFYQLAVINYVISQPKSDTTYSFFNRIRIEERDTDNEVITAHEQAHARHWHSADILLLEAIMILNWFNPVVYMYRNAVKHIHEFIADRDVLKAGANKAEYAMLLLSQTFITPPYHLVNPFFNSSLLKRRIMMLHKNKSNRVMLMKYGLSAPLFMLMLVLSSATVNNSKTIQVINNTAQHVFTTPAARTFDPEHLSADDQADLAAAIRQNEQAASQAAMDESSLQPVNLSGNVKYTAITQNASFPGGQAAFNSYVGGNIRYPAEARQKNIQGKVYCTFIVEKDGTVSNPKVIHGIGGGADEEALKVVAAMPKWAPAMQNGQAIRQQFTIPISFTLTGDKTMADEGNEVFTAVEQMTEFPGGLPAFGNYLSKNIRYPAVARENHVQGKVFLTFVVEKDGSITDIKVLRGIGSGADEEAVRVIKNSPKWKPAMQNGRLVRAQFTVPISFALKDNDTESNGKDTVSNLATIKTKNAIDQNAHKYSANNAVPTRNTDTAKLEAHFTSVAKSQPVFADGRNINAAVINKTPTAGIKVINQFKEKAAKGIISEKATNGVVLMITKHKPFYDQESITN